MAFYRHFAGTGISNCFSSAGFISACLSKSFPRTSTHFHHRRLLMQKRTFLRICFAIYLAVLVLWTPPSSTEGIQNSTKCNSLCFHPPEFFLLSSLSNIKGAVVIGGVNFSAPTDDPKMVRLALQGSNFSPVI